MRNLTSHGRSVVMLVLALIVFGALAALLPRNPQLKIDIEMAVATSPNGQVFYDPSGQFSEANSVHLTLVPDGVFRTYSVTVPAMGGGGSVRIDPGSAPGRVGVRRIVLESAGAEVTLAGQSLSDLQPLNHMRPERVGDVLWLASTGNDPSFLLRLPQGLDRAASLVLARKAAMVIACLALLALVAIGRHWWMGIVRRAIDRHPVWIVPVTIAAVWLLATMSAVGCASNLCTSGRSLGYGALLTIALLALAALGGVLVTFAARGRTAGKSPAIFLWVVVGQVGLMVYVYARSLLAAALPLPVTRIELAVLAGAAFVFLWTRTDLRHSLFGSPAAQRWTLARLGALAALAVWIADRELPRLVMLSSDPEIHALFAKQIGRLGSVPHAAQGWEGGVFNYPAGSGVLGYVWASLSGLDVRNALAALPLIQCVLAALVVTEHIAASVRDIAGRVLLILLALGVTFAGFLFPLYEQYSHMEGLARQMSSGLFALFIVLLFASRRSGIADDRVAALVLAAGLFALGVLNPVNLMVPCALVAAFAAGRLLVHRRLSPAVLVPPAAALLLMLDPYYSALLLGDESGPGKIALDQGVRHLSGDEIFSGWLASSVNFRDFARAVLVFPTSSPLPLFFAMLAALAGMLLAVTRRFRCTGTGAVFTAVLIVLLWLMYSAFIGVQNDSRFYLLAPYFEFSLAQHKALLLTCMSALVVALVHVRYRRFGRTAVVAALVALAIAALIRPVQPHRLDPRFDYCGSLGCPAASDIEVIGKIAASPPVAPVHGSAAKILVPNAVLQLGREKWLFPVGGSRLLAQEADMPLAFYYYHGDDDFTTANYVKHVCEGLDRKWLQSQGIRYVFLPADRAGACLASSEALRVTERVLASSGNSYFIELR